MPSSSSSAFGLYRAAIIQSDSIVRQTKKLICRNYCIIISSFHISLYDLTYLSAAGRTSKNLKQNELSWYASVISIHSMSLQRV